MNHWLTLKKIKNLITAYLSNDEIAFFVVVLAGYSILFASQPSDLSPAKITLLLVLGLVYILACLVGSRWVDRVRSFKQTLFFFVVMIALAGFLNYLSHMSLWLILLPISSTAIEYLPKRWGMVVNIIIWLIILLPIILTQSIQEIILIGAPIFAALVFVAVFTRIMIQERRLRGELEIANQKLRDYATKVEDLATAQERNRLAREIHDGLGHYLTAINIQIKASQSVVKENPQLALESMNNAQTLTQEALADVRRSISSLRNDPSSNRPLVEVLSKLVKETRASGIDAQVESAGQVRPLSQQVEFTLYRAAQEALTNVRKYARASRVNLKLDYQVDKVCLEIWDNGIGAENIEGGFGLIGLQERVQLLNGSLTIKTAPGEGFMLKIDILA